MFIKDKNSNESYIHICDGKTEKQMRQKEVEIRLHDVSIFTIICDENRKPHIEHIKFCPYCGCDLEEDAFPSDDNT